MPGPATVAHRRRELALARALGVGTGIFLLAWGPLSLVRWMGMGPGYTKFEAGFDVLYGLLLVLPFARIPSVKIWRRLMITLLVTSILFVFVLVFDVLFAANLYVENANPTPPRAADQKALYIDDDDSGPSLPLPVLNCALVFLALLQVPAVYFSRHPEQMD